MKTNPGTGTFCCFWRDEYGTGLRVYSSAGNGVAGAALATVMGYVVGGGIPLIYFAKKKRPWSSARENKILRKTNASGSINGSSELMTIFPRH